jgi:hypothetical protein
LPWKAATIMAPAKKENQSTHVFIRDANYAWIPAVQEKINGDTAIVQVPTYPNEQSMACDGGRAAKKGEQRTIKLKEYPSGVLPLQNVDANGCLVECTDMVKLPYLHEVRTNKNKNDPWMTTACRPIDLPIGTA